MFETQGGHAESNPRPSEEEVSFYHVLRPLDHRVEGKGTMRKFKSPCINSDEEPPQQASHYYP